MARATQSYGLFVQQFGRGCRLLDGKNTAYIIDHVGNVVRHGLPDKPRIHSLNRRDKSAKKEKDPDVIPIRVCGNPACVSPFERVLISCPFCGWIPVPADRTSPEMVDGDMFEIDPEMLAIMRGDINKVDQHPDNVKNWMKKAGHNDIVANSAAKRHRERQESQNELRHVMSWYGGLQQAMGNHIRVAQRTFYHQFGVDVMSAQTLGKNDADELKQRILIVLNKHGVNV
jgi:superfamily II DNA or RNA helicase